MKANEFVKRFGWCEAKEAIKNVAWCETAYCTRLGHGCFKTKSDCCIDINDLKRLVESHELVTYVGGLDKAKEQIYVLTMEVNGFNPEKLERAIADVESCR